jgi:hypothetical protein
MGKVVDGALISAAIVEEVAQLKQSGSELPTLADATALFERLCLAEELEPFLTLPAYRHLLEIENDICNRSST